MFRNALILVLVTALLFLAGCVTVTPVTDRGAAFGPCAQMMPYWYCGPGP